MWPAVLGHTAAVCLRNPTGSCRMASVSVSIHDVLEGLRGTALDERDKGDRFERLVLNLLRTEPEWVSRFSGVWLWSEWPERGGRPDTGIDLVAKYRDRQGYAAIQCKFYDPLHRVSKGDLDTFLSASGGSEFVARYFFDTADNWDSNAVETARHQAVPVQRVDLAYLDWAKIDWSQYSWSTPDEPLASSFDNPRVPWAASRARATQLPQVPSFAPGSRATCAIGFPVSSTIRTAPSRSSRSHFFRFLGISILVVDAPTVREGSSDRPDGPVRGW